jgi:serine/threonine protein kinase
MSRRKQVLTRRESAIDLEPRLMRDFENSELVDILLSAPQLKDFTFYDEPQTAFGCTSDYVLVEALQKSTGKMVTCKLSRQVLRIQRDLYFTSRLVRNDTHDLVVRPIGAIKLPEYGLIMLVLDADIYDILRHQDQLATLSLQDFLHFAIRACYCLEFIHSQGIVHGEIRPDALLWSKVDQVRLLPFGSGTCSWENALSSESWQKLSQERGLDKRLAFISPEQTGRTGKEPGHRTDLYSLGMRAFNEWCPNSRSHFLLCLDATATLPWLTYAGVARSPFKKMS